MEKTFNEWIAIERYFNECCEYFKEKYKDNYNLNEYSKPTKDWYSFDLDTKIASKDKNNCIDFYLDLAVKFYDYLKSYELYFLRDDETFDIKIDFTKDKEYNLKEIEIKRNIMKGMKENFIPLEYDEIHLKDEYNEMLDLYSGKFHFSESEMNIWDGESGVYMTAFWLTKLKEENTDDKINITFTAKC